MENMSEKTEPKENFINKFKHLVNLGKKKFNKFIDFLNTNGESDLVREDELTLLEQFQDWLLDILQYGVMLSIIYNTFLGWQGWLNIPLVVSLGLIRWVVFDSISTYRLKE